MSLPERFLYCSLGHAQSKDPLDQFPLTIQLTAKPRKVSSLQLSGLPEKVWPTTLSILTSMTDINHALDISEFY